MHVAPLPKGQGTVTAWRELLCVWGWATWGPGRAGVSRGGCLRGTHPQQGRWPAPSSAAHPTQAAWWRCTPTHPQRNTGLLCRRDSRAQDIPILPIPFLSSGKNAVKLLALSVRPVSLPRQGLPAYPTWENTPKYYYFKQWDHLKYLMLGLEVLIEGPACNQISLLCVLPIPWQRQLIWNWAPCNRNSVSKHPQQWNLTRLTDAIKELKKKNTPASEAE